MTHMLPGLLYSILSLVIILLGNGYSLEKSLPLLYRMIHLTLHVHLFAYVSEHVQEVALDPFRFFQVSLHLESDLLKYAFRYPFVHCQVYLCKPRPSFPNVGTNGLCCFRSNQIVFENKGVKAILRFNCLYQKHTSFILYHYHIKTVVVFSYINHVGGEI